MAVPIYGADGAFYGVCGFEISRIYYSYFHLINASEKTHLIGLLAQKEAEYFRAGSGFESSTHSGYSANIKEGAIETKTKGLLTYFSYGQDRYVGVERPITMSPLDGTDEWSAAVMIKESEYNALSSDQTVLLILLTVLVLAISILVALLLSKSYVKPITDGFAMIKEGNTNRSIIPEINDLLDFLAEQEAQKERDGQSAEDMSPIIASYNNFMRRLETLTAAERDIFDLYMSRHTAEQSAEKQYITMSTVKFHNNNIFRKLGINSRSELMLLSRIIQGEDGGNNDN
jgi:DNA-binding CsgD family transcriptional regulator